MELTTKANFFLRIKPVTLSNGDTGFVRGISWPDRQRFFDECGKMPEGSPELMGQALFVSMTVCDSQGTLIFSPEDVRELATTGHDKIIIEFYDCSSDFNRIKAKEIVDEKKESGEVGTVVSG